MCVYIYIYIYIYIIEVIFLHFSRLFKHFDVVSHVMDFAMLINNFSRSNSFLFPDLQTPS